MALYVVTAVAPLLVIAWRLAETRIGGALFIQRLLGFYAIAYIAINLRRLTGTWQLRATALVLVSFGLVYAAEQQSYWSASVWIPAPTGDEEDFDISHRRSESLLFDQRSKIDAVVQRFDPPIEIFSSWLSHHTVHPIRCSRCPMAPLSNQFKAIGEARNRANRERCKIAAIVQK